MAWLGVVTNAGKELLGGWLAGQTLQISGAAGGSGTVREAALLAQTELVEQQQMASIVSYKTVEGGQKIKLQFPAADTAYQLNQIGVWGNCGGENKLLALFQKPEGVAISSRAEFPDFAYTFYAVLAIGNEGALAVTVDAEAWVTIKTLQEALEGYVKVNAEGKIPDAVLPAMDYIPKTEKNAADGVAGLDGNKKIPLAQLPLDAELSNTSENPVQNKVINAALAGKVPTTRKVNNKALSADISLSAADVGARPSTWTPTAAEVGAAVSNHTHTAAQVGAAAANHTHTAAQVGAAASNHTHTAAQVGAAASNHTHTAAQVGAAAASHTHTTANITDLKISKCVGGMFVYPKYGEGKLNVSLDIGFLPRVLFISNMAGNYIGKESSSSYEQPGIIVFNISNSNSTHTVPSLISVAGGEVITITFGSQSTNISSDKASNNSNQTWFRYFAIG